jgi:hypothetical protein
MSARTFALILGAVYLLVGILGFIPALVSSPVTAAPDGAAGDYGLLFGLFPINALHNLVHLAIGAWGLYAGRTLPAARTFSRALAWIFGALAVMGLIPGLRTVFGLVPLFGHDIWLHALTALAGAWFGYRTEPVGPIEFREERARERSRL